MTLTTKLSPIAADVTDVKIKHEELHDNTPFQAGVRLYDQPRPEGDRDLVAEVRAMLVKSGVPEQDVAICYDNNRHIKSAKDRASVVQRIEINRFLQLSLIQYPDTMTLRSEFLPHSPIDVWTDVVEKKVAPFIAEHKLLS